MAFTMRTTSTDSMGDGSTLPAMSTPGGARPRGSLDGRAVSGMEVEIQFADPNAPKPAAPTPAVARAAPAAGAGAAAGSTAAAAASPAAAAAGAGAGVGAASAGADGLVGDKTKTELKDFVTGLLRKKMAYELIPGSGKVVVFDVNLPVKHAFNGLLEHDIKCAPVWDPKSRAYVGMLTVTDFIDILRHFHATVNAVAHDSKTQNNLKASDLGEQRISDWAAIKKNQGTSIPRLLCISPEGSLLEAVRLTMVHRVHRLCVVQRALANTVLCILEHHRILEFIRDELRQDARFHQLTLKACGLGTLSDLIKVSDDTRLIEVLNLMAVHKISAVPVVDANGIAIDAYSRSDVRFIALDKTYNKLDMTIRDAIGPHRNERPVPTCSVNDTLDTVLSRLIATGKHRLIIVGRDNKLEGLVSLTDILQYVLHDAAHDSANSLLFSATAAAGGTGAAAATPTLTATDAAVAAALMQYGGAPSPSPSPSPMATPVMGSKSLYGSGSGSGSGSGTPTGGGAGGGLMLPPLHLGGGTPPQPGGHPMLTMQHSAPLPAHHQHGATLAVPSAAAAVHHHLLHAAPHQPPQHAAAAGAGAGAGAAAAAAAAHHGGAGSQPNSARGTPMYDADS